MVTTIDLRKRNTLTILRMIIESESVTKTDVAAKTNFTLMTVNTIMNNLFKKGILTTCGIASSNNGRKAALYSVNTESYYIIGVDIGVDSVTLAISDLNLKIKELLIIDFNRGNTPEEVIDLIHKAILKMLENQKIKKENVFGLGIVVPGPVDEISGVIHYLPNLEGWNNIPLKEIFEEKLDMQVFIEKDNYASVLYLKKNIGTAYKNVVSLTIKGGIGTGILVGGSLYRGENNIAGEIGHVAVDIDGPRCNCGNFGCLEVYAADFSIVKDVKKSIKNGEKSSSLVVYDNDIEHLHIENIIIAANDGDVLCRNAIFKAAKYIGIAVSNAIKYYDPAYFIINCKWISEIDGVSSVITKIVKDQCTLMQQDKINLVYQYEEDAYLKGALMLVREYMLNNIVNNRFID